MLVDNREEAIAKAKTYVEKRAGSPTGERNWLIAAAPDSYGDEYNRVELQILEGSPPRGFVLIGRQRVVAMDAHFERALRWEFLK